MLKFVIAAIMVVTGVFVSVAYHVTQKADIAYYAGHRYFEKGEYADAIPLLRRSASLKPSHTRALRELGFACQWTGNYGEADAAFRAFLAIRPDDIAVKRALAETLSWQKRYPEAMALLRQILAETADPSAMLDLAELYQWQGDFKRSRAALAILPAERRGDVRARLVLARALLYTGEAEAALRIIDALLGMPAAQKDAKLYREVGALQAEATMIARDYERAIERYRKLVEAEPDNMQARTMLADMLAWTKRYDEAIAEYGTIIARRPGDASVRAKLAELYAWTKRYDEAERTLRAVLAADPGDRKSRILLADILSWQGRYDEALAAYREATEGAPEDPAVMKRIADAAAWGKKYDVAERMYRAILARDPDDPSARLALARILSWQKRYGESIVAYSDALARSPGDDVIRFELARVYSWDKEFPEAEKLYREVLARDPRHVDARAALGEILIWQRKYREAIGYFKGLLAEKDDPRLRLLYGQALLYAAEYAESRAVFTGLLAADPRNVAAKTLLADSHAYTKDFKRAEELYREALATGYDRDTKRKYADVLSWDKQYDRAIALYEELLQEEADDRIRLQKARVLGWARRYAEALREYRALAEKSRDPLIRLEMDAKAAYWGDRVERSIRDYNALVSRDPENVEAMFDLAQIYSYQSMWAEAKGEYDRILALTPNHFRAQDGREKVAMITERVAWDTGYDFVEADSQSRDMDIRKRTIFNEWAGYVRPDIKLDGLYNFSTRDFSDFSPVIENEGKIRLTYLNGPVSWASAYYDLIVYNHDIDPMNTFGGEFGHRIGDTATVLFSYDRDRLQNSSSVIRWHEYQDDLTGRIDVTLSNRLKLGADYTYAHYSDRNFRNEPGFDVLYFFSLDPLRLSVTYRYFYREFDDKTPDYFSPKGFTTNALFWNWRHYLNKEEVFFGADDLYYDLGYNCSVDSETIVGHTYSGGLHWDASKRFSLDVKGYFTRSSNKVYKDQGLTGTVKYYF